MEAINHAQAAGVPMVFAITKIDKPNADVDRIKSELANMNILVEDWGGKYQCQEIDAKHGTNVQELLEKVLLEADLLCHPESRHRPLPPAYRPPAARHLQPGLHGLRGHPVRAAEPVMRRLPVSRRVLCVSEPTRTHPAGQKQSQSQAGPFSPFLPIYI